MSRYTTSPAGKTAERLSTSRASPTPGSCSHQDPLSSNARHKRHRKRKREGGARSDNVCNSASERLLWRTPWVNTLGMTEYESTRQRLHDEIVAYVVYCTSSEQESRARTLVVKRVEALIRKRFSSCEVQVFGSVALDLCLPGSDVDLVIQTPEIYDHKYRTRVLFQLSSMLRNALFCRSATVAAGARVPIVTFETMPELGSISFDISINADDGLRGINVIKKHLSSLPPLRHLVLVLKSFLYKRSLHTCTNGGLSSYALTCLITCFLKLNPNKRSQKDINTFMENESLGTLLMDFFEFYGVTMDWHKACVVPARGEIVSKESMGYTNSKFEEALSIDCMVNPGRDIGRSASRACQIRGAFRQAYETLRHYNLSMANNNVLGTVVGISQKALDHRDRIRHLVDSGELEANLQALELPNAWSAPANGSRNQYRGSYTSRRDVSHSGYYHDYYPYNGGYTAHQHYPGMLSYSGAGPTYNHSWAACPMNSYYTPTPYSYSQSGSSHKRQRTQ